MPSCPLPGAEGRWLMAAGVTGQPIELTCQVCSDAWTVPRRRGVYPQRCAECVAKDPDGNRTRTAARRAQKLGRACGSRRSLEELEQLRVTAAAKANAITLCARAKVMGLPARLVEHEKHGHVVYVETPWHGEEVLLKTADDLDWLAVELVMS